MVEISNEEYKLAKEAHVSNCTGGRTLEIALVCHSIILSHFIWYRLVDAKKIKPDSFFPQFAIYVIPLLSYMTWASNYIYYIPMLGLVFHQVVKRPQNLKRPQKEEAQKPYLTVYRAGLMIMTCAAILAVDFQFFPRRFAKVETFGTSLMDMGVGSFVFSSGVVSSRSYMNNKQPSLLKSFRSGFVILLLGFARFFLTKSVDYQEHHSEYGLHWNFFFTLGFLPPVMTLLGFLRKQMPFAVLAIVVIVIYQVVLNLGLQDWVMNAPRTGLISANKEGICSFFGYLSIFLFGLQTGEFIFQNKSIQLPNTSPMSSETSIAFSGGILFLVYNIWIYLFPKYDVSRGMANLPYVLWVVASNLILIFDLIAIEKKAIKFVKSAPPLLVAINNNGLFTFLLANILTGLINLSMRTLYMNTWSSILVNVCYLLIVTSVPWIMWNRFHFRIKL